MDKFFVTVYTTHPVPFSFGFQDKATAEKCKDMFLEQIGREKSVGWVCLEGPNIAYTIMVASVVAITVETK